MIKKLFGIAAVMGLMLVGSVQAQESTFTPEISFELSDTKVKANPELKIHVEQSEEEEELSSVELFIPKGFNLPADDAIPNNTTLGSGQIQIKAGPACRPDAGGNIPVGGMVTLPATLQEIDRNDDQISSGVYAVWRLNIQGVTNITLEITGSKKQGFKLAGPIPANDNTCPPLVFDMTVNAKAANDVPILTNAAKPKNHKFAATFISQDSPAVVTIVQKIKLTK